MIVGMLVTLLLAVAVCVLLYGLDVCSKPALYLGTVLFVVWGIVVVFH